MIAFRSTDLSHRSLTTRIDKLLFSKMFKLTKNAKLIGYWVVQWGHFCDISSEIISIFTI
jgi:hypothetical protein